VEVVYPRHQTCCGQPMANAGFEKQSIKTYELFIENFHAYDYVVAPSGSCVYHIREHYDVLEQDEDVMHVRKNIYELCEFLAKVLRKDKLDAEFPYRVGLHQSCHGLRGLRLAKSSEIVHEGFSIPHQLLRHVKGIKLVELGRADECCGFGGSFAVTEEVVSVKMGVDRVQDHIHNKAEVITATDMSCLMHLDGIIRRENLPIKVKHIVEILNSTV
jgi:L-lactate dehydrogenase complex protein LldE